MATQIDTRRYVVGAGADSIMYFASLIDHQNVIMHETAHIVGLQSAFNTPHRDWHLGLENVLIAVRGSEQAHRNLEAMPNVKLLA